jgi:hypothetical protein
MTDPVGVPPGSLHFRPHLPLFGTKTSHFFKKPSLFPGFFIIFPRIYTEKFRTDTKRIQACLEGGSKREMKGSTEEKQRA